MNNRIDVKWTHISWRQALINSLRAQCFSEFLLATFNEHPTVLCSESTVFIIDACEAELFIHLKKTEPSWPPRRMYSNDNNDHLSLELNISEVFIVWIMSESWLTIQ